MSPYDSESCSLASPDAIEYCTSNPRPVLAAHNSGRFLGGGDNPQPGDQCNLDVNVVCGLSQDRMEIIAFDTETLTWELDNDGDIATGLMPSPKGTQRRRYHCINAGSAGMSFTALNDTLFLAIGGLTSSATLIASTEMYLLDVKLNEGACPFLGQSCPH